MATVNINVGEKGLDKILYFFKEFFNQPKWLLTLTAVIIILGGSYFAYGYYRDKKDFIELQNNVEIINKCIKENLNITDYKQNLIYTISEIKLIQVAEQSNYEEELLELELLEDFIQRRHPHDRILEDIRAMKSRLKINHDVHKKQYDYIMKNLDEFISDTTMVNVKK